MRWSIINLISGDEKLLYDWLSYGFKWYSEGKDLIKQLSGKISRKTLNHILSLPKCKICNEDKINEN
jgi:hypothetical protein